MGILVGAIVLLIIVGIIQVVYKGLLYYLCEKEYKECCVLEKKISESKDKYIIERVSLVRKKRKKLLDLQDKIDSDCDSQQKWINSSYIEKLWFRYLTYADLVHTNWGSLDDDNAIRIEKTFDLWIAYRELQLHLHNNE